MLNRLIEYADAHEIKGEQGFSTKRIRWLIQFDPTGEFIGVYDYGKSGKEFSYVPHLQFSGDSPMRQFLVDTLQYLLLYEVSDTDEKYEKIVSKHKYCLSKLKEAAVVDQIFGSIATSIEDKEVLSAVHSEISQQKPKALQNNNATFAVKDGNNVRILVEDLCWHNWWRETFPSLLKKGKAKEVELLPGRCFLSGALDFPVLTHPKIKGLAGVGGNAETSLISFDKGSDAFQSYGFIQSQNATVSSAMAAQYSAALNRLLSHQHHQLAGSEIVYWYTEDIPPKDDVLKGILDGIGGFVEDENEQLANHEQKEASANIVAKKFLKSIADGVRPEFLGVEYCAMSLVGNQGRAVVQNWMEGSFTELAQHVEEWFSDLEIVRVSGKGPANFPRIETLITCLLKERKKDTKYIVWVKPASGFREAVWNASVRGREFSFSESLVKQILLRFRESVLNGEFAEALAEDGQKRDMRRARLYARMGLLKSFLIRNHDKNEREVTMGLNPESKNSIYQFGRLFAVLADLQRRSQDNEVKSTIVDRFYPTATTSPKLVHGRLISLSNYHLRKLERSKPGTAWAIRNEIASIHDKINLDEVDDLLNMNEQSYFALGYYQQIAEMNRRISEWIANRKDKTKKEEVTIDE